MYQAQRSGGGVQELLNAQQEVSRDTCGKSGAQQSQSNPIMHFTETQTKSKRKLISKLLQILLKDTQLHGDFGKGHRRRKDLKQDAHPVTSNIAEGFLSHLLDITH